MSAFAPAYHQESNNAWLNELVTDIIDPVNHAPTRAGNGDSEVDSANFLDPEIERRSSSQLSKGRRRYSTPSRSHRQTTPASGDSMRLPSYNGCSHYSYRSTTPRAGHSSPRMSSQRSTPVQCVSIESVPKEGSLLSLNPFHPHAQCYSPDIDRTSPSTLRGISASPASLDRYAQSAYTVAADSLASSEPFYPGEISSRHAIKRSSIKSPAQPANRNSPVWPDEAYMGSAREKAVRSAMTDRTRTSLGRTYSEKRLSELQKLPTLDRIVSEVADEFAGFAPHPAVRLFGDREKLGEAAGPNEDDDHKYPEPFALALIIVGICLSVFIISVDRNIVTTAIPQITETFNAYSDIGWYGSAYFLTASAFQPLYGRIYMSFDTRWTFLLALFIFELGSLLGAVSPSSDVLILGRAIQGFGSAGLLTGSFVVGTHSVPLRGRPVLFAFVGILYGIGALAGPLLGGVFTDLLTWRWAFWINLPVGAVTFVGVFFFFKPRKAKTQENRPTFVRRVLQLDLIGNAILLGACVMLFLALQLSETRGSWNNVPVIGLLCGFGASVVVFIAWLFYRGDRALIPPRIIRQRTVAASCGAAFFIYAGLLLHAYYLPIWFQAVKGDSAIHSGVNMIPYMLANALFSLLAGIFVSKNGLFAPPAIVGTAIGTIGCGLLATVNEDTSTSKWIGYEILISAGLGMAIQQGFSAVQTALPLEQVPIGTAAVVASQSLGGAIFVSIGNTILQSHLLNQNADGAIPDVDVRAVFQMGATAFREFVPESSLPALVRLYNESLQGVFIAVVPLIGCAFLCSLCMEWRSVKAKQELAGKREGLEKA